MEKVIEDAVAVVIPLIEAVGAVVVALGVLVAFAAYCLAELRVRPASYEEVRLLLGRFLALGLEFQLGADILATAVSPNWDDIGKLGAIATIRTVLNVFLTKELERTRAARHAA